MVAATAEKGRCRVKRRLMLRRSTAASLGQPVAVADLAQGAPEKRRRVTKRDAALAVRRAAIGFAINALINIDHVGAFGAEHLYRLVEDDVAIPIKRHQIGLAITLAGDNQQPTALQGRIRNERIADDDGGDIV